MDFATISQSQDLAGNPEQQKAARCFHCGAEAGQNPIEDADKAFCCTGCLTVYKLLDSHQLGGYYQLETFPGQRPEDGEGKYSWLSDPLQASHLLEYQDSKQAKITFKLPTMHCAACIWLLEQLYKIQPGIMRSEVDFPRRELSMSFDPAVIDLEKIATLLEALGYPPALSLADAESPDKKSKSKVNRAIWYELGIAGFCFGNIMLLSFPEYFNLNDPGLYAMFRWLNFGLSLPVVAFSARSYYRSAWAGLKHKMINMDVPITLGILVLFARSAFEVFTSTGSGYFDSLAGLVFFLLIGKAYQRKTYHMLSFERDYRSYFPISVSQILGGKEKTVAVNKLQAGDQIVLRNGELIVADGLLLSGEAQIDYSFVTGESDPVPVQPGEKIYAGGRQTAGPINMVLEKEVSQGYLTKLWNHEAFRKKKAAEITQLSDKIGQRFTPIVLLIAAVAAIFWAFYDASMIWNVISSVLIVACPCALALSTPFTLGHVLRVFGRMGFYLKGPAVVESLAEADAMIFDKTGTLTSMAEAKVVYEGEAFTEEEGRMVKALLGGSIHPLSRRLFQWFPKGDLLEVEDFQEIKGKGTTGIVNGVPLKIGSSGFMGHEEASTGGVFVAIDGQLKGRFSISNELRTGIAPLLSQLGKNMQLGLLSGDHAGAEAQMRSIMPEGAEINFKQDPAAKLDYIRGLQANNHKVAMVGDGLNDAGALRQADIGIAITDDLAAFTPSSDAILGGKSINLLPEFIQLSKDALRIVRKSFVISFAYNAIGISFAVSGHLSPLVAAILMPLSSVSVVLFTTAAVSLKARRRFRKISTQPINQK